MTAQIVCGTCGGNHTTGFCEASEEDFYELPKATPLDRIAAIEKEPDKAKRIRLGRGLLNNTSWMESIAVAPVGTQVEARDRLRACDAVTATDFKKALDNAEKLYKAKQSTRPKQRQSTAPSGLARDDPANDRRRMLECGSQEEIGKLVIDVVRVEGDGETPVYDDGQFSEYREKMGLWVAVAYDELHRIVGSFDGSVYCDGDREHNLRVSDAFAQGAIKRAAVRVRSPGFFAGDPSVLAFANGVVRVSDTGEVELLERSPDHRCRAGYPFAFDPDAECERFERMMRENFECDYDAQQKIDYMDEFFGLCLLGKATKLQKCLSLPSKGRTGRSTTLEIIDEAMPAGTVSHIAITDLVNPERLTRLPGMRLNYSDEAPPDAFLENEDFKRVVVGNKVTAEGKYKDSFEYRPIAGHVVVTQHTSSAELSEAFFGRFGMVRYNRSWENDPKRDFYLADKIIGRRAYEGQGELPGVVARLIRAGARMLKRGGGYILPPSHFKELENWKLNADSVRAFVDAKYTRSTTKEPRTEGYDLTGRPNGKAIKPHDWTEAAKFYAQYRQWCEDNGYRKPVSNPEFKRRVEAIGYPPTHNHRGNFYGVRLLETAQKKANDQALELGRPPEALKGAVSILQGVPKLAIVKNPKT